MGASRFGLIIGEGNRRIIEKAQGVVLARCEAQEQVVSGSVWRATTPFAACFHHCSGQRRLGLVKVQPLGDYGIVTAMETLDEPGLQDNVPFPRQAGGVGGATQEDLHLSRPILLLDLNEGLSVHEGGERLQSACSAPCMV